MPVEYATLSRIGVQRLESERHLRMAQYNYFRSTCDQYILSRDGVAQMAGTEAEVWDFIHKNHCYSVEHALKYEGYTITPQEMV